MNVYIPGITKKPDEHDNAWTITFGACSTRAKAQERIECEIDEGSYVGEGEHYFVREERVDGLDRKTWVLVGKEWRLAEEW